MATLTTTGMMLIQKMRKVSWTAKKANKSVLKEADTEFISSKEARHNKESFLVMTCADIVWKTSLKLGR